ncbi:hypothetical protein WBG99_33240 [Streptomyces sp. TG1A-60]|uniref:hypothetical protein n=1 Tax=Streptomyces sp. TG1A-60 TaxID=3129111 RepID=UPI0030D3E87B
MKEERDMGRSGVIKPAELPPGARRDLNQELHRLHRRAGEPTVRRIADGISRATGTVHNAFSKPELPRHEVVMAIVNYLAELMRYRPNANPEEEGDKIDRRVDRLWQEARYEEEEALARADQAESWPPLSDATRGLIHALSPECCVCGETRRLLDIILLEDPDTVPWPPGFRKTRWEPAAPNPWRLVRLCGKCQRGRRSGELTEQQLRDARSALDHRPGAARHYAAYLDQILLGAEPALDTSVAALALAVVQTDPSLVTAPYVLSHGRIKVDRARGSLSWGQYGCTDDH